ncbi:selenium binding protein [Proteus myxofaciens]|uniref:Uncharacterized protein n=1 Tax=Proteus myxofaciens ATCC 19692 TaxID=1354337 RepID=A0A198G0T2_9GAMM|nr:selenium binding protein [Proteus myxofaciens]OAT30947.1 hypothetical protein M983_1466 [Proteus myxofaciens ATCC 19692]
MYEDYSRQSLPSKKYRELLGTAFCVFNSNNKFVIENILKLDRYHYYSWYELIDKDSALLLTDIKKTITRESGPEIAETFNELVQMRARLVQSFQVTVDDGVDNQILATRYSDGRQEYITQQYLLNFIKLNQKLSDLLYDLRGY